MLLKNICFGLSPGQGNIVDCLIVNVSIVAVLVLHIQVFHSVSRIVRGHHHLKSQSCHLGRGLGGIFSNKHAEILIANIMFRNLSIKFMHLTHKQTIWIGNLIAKAAIVIIDIIRVDLVAGFLKDIADAAPLHGDEVDRVLEGENVEEVVVEDLSDLQDFDPGDFFTSDYLHRRPDTPIVVKCDPGN